MSLDTLNKVPNVNAYTIQILAVNVFGYTIWTSIFLSGQSNTAYRQTNFTLTQTNAANQESTRTGEPSIGTDEHKTGPKRNRKEI